MRLGEWREALQVGEEGCDVSVLTAKASLSRICEQCPGDLRRQILAEQPAHDLEGAVTLADRRVQRKEDDDRHASDVQDEEREDNCRREIVRGP